MGSFIDYIIANFRLLSIVLTILIFIVVVLLRLASKNWDFKNIGWGLNDYVQALISAYTIPTGFLIMLCCTNVTKLASATDVWLYLFVAGGSLVYTSISSIYNHIKQN